MGEPENNPLLRLERLLEQGALPEAAAELEPALEQWPRQAELWHFKARLAERLLEFETAQLAYEQALVLEPEAADLHAALAQLLIRLSLFDSAQKHFEAARAFAPEVFEHTLALIEYYLLQGERQSALIYLKEALTQNPESAQAFALLARTLYLYGRWPEARDALRQSLSLDPSFEAALIQLLQGALELGDFVEAQRIMSQDYAFAPSHQAQGSYLQACYYYLQGDLPLAREHWQRAALQQELTPAFLQIILASPLIPQTQAERQEWLQLITQGLDLFLSKTPAYWPQHRPLMAWFPDPSAPLTKQLGEWFSSLVPRSQEPVDVKEPPYRVGLICSDLRKPEVLDWLLTLFEHHQHAGLVYQLFYLHPAELPDALEPWASSCLQLPDHPQALARIVRDFELRALGYLDLEHSLYSLAMLRPLGLQLLLPTCHQSSGLVSLDKVFCGPRLAGAEWSETPVQLSEDPLWFRPREPQAANRSDWNLPRLGHLYLCAAAPQYWLPEWDQALQALLQTDRKAFVLGVYAAGTVLHTYLQQRHAESLGDRQHRVRWLELNPERLPELISLVDMLIEPWEAGSAWASFQALSQGIPVLACPGRSLPSRQSAIWLERMGLSELILRQPQDLAQRADMLSRPTERAMLKERLRAARASLLDQAACVSAFETGLYQELTQSNHA